MDAVYAGNEDVEAGLPYDHAGTAGYTPSDNLHAMQGKNRGHVHLEGSSYLAFQDKLVRHGFIRKVYAILSLQLLVTFGAALLFTYTKSIRDYVQTDGVWLFYTAWVMTLVAVITLACCGNARRTYPTNYILLAFVTVCEAYLVATVASFYTSASVVMCVGITCILAGALTLFACQTKYDITTASGTLFSFLLALIMLGFLQLIFPGEFLSTLIAVGGALLFSAYIVYDTQVLMSGKKFQLSPDEYVLAALQLYLDIINLFLYLLMLFGKRR
jgi:FtsH-binding integral membrane protein